MDVTCVDINVFFFRMNLRHIQYNSYDVEPDDHTKRTVSQIVTQTLFVDFSVYYLQISVRIMLFIVNKFLF